MKTKGNDHGAAPRRRAGGCGAAAALLLLGLGGCATAGGGYGVTTARASSRRPPPPPAQPKPGHKPSYVVRVVFDAGGCAKKVDVDTPNCDGSPSDCIKISPGEKVTFQAVRPDASGVLVPSNDEFEVQLDPFRTGVIASSRGTTPPVIADAPLAPTKRYPYDVASVADPTCILDPTFIVE